MKNIAIFASGSGSNAEAIARYFQDSDCITMKHVLTNRLTAGVHRRMAEIGVPTTNFTKEEWNEATPITDFLQKEKIDFIVLAGFLAKIEPSIVKAFEGKMINIHPSLLPKFGGKGMWGHYVHEAVIAAGEKQSGITIHYIDEVFDNGEIIFQATCDVLPDDTPETLAERIHSLEHLHYPRVIEELLSNQD